MICNAVPHATVRPRMLSTVVALALALGAVAASPRQALAQPSVIERPYGGTRPLVLDVHAGFSWLGLGLAAGARFGIPIVHNGFIANLNNAVYINFGADLYFVHYKSRADDIYAVGLGLPVTMHWEFYFTPRWTAFGEVGINFYLHPSLIHGDGWAWSPGHWLIIAAGGRYMLSESLALTLRVGNPYVAFGVSFMF